MQPKRFANKRKKYHCPLSLLHPVTVTHSKLTQKKGSSNNNSNKMPTWLPQLRACGQLVSMATDLITNKVIFNWITAKVDGKTFSSYHAHKHTHTFTQCMQWLKNWSIFSLKQREKCASARTESWARMLLLLDEGARIGYNREQHCSPYTQQHSHHGACQHLL